jgi:hypothetical protein
VTPAWRPRDTPNLFRHRTRCAVLPNVTPVARLQSLADPTTAFPMMLFHPSPELPAAPTGLPSFVAGGGMGIGGWIASGIVVSR